MLPFFRKRVTPLPLFFFFPTSVMRSSSVKIRAVAFSLFVGKPLQRILKDETLSKSFVVV